MTELEATPQGLAEQETPAGYDAELAAAYDRAHAAEAETQPAQEAVQEPAQEAVEVALPSDLPSNLRDHWAAIPEQARAAVLAGHRDLQQRMAEQGRVVKAAKPVFDVLVQAAQDIPTIRNMTPDALARDVFQMAQFVGALNENPVNAILAVAQRHNALDGLRQALGQQGSPDMAREIADLKRQLAQVAAPDAIESKVNSILTMRSATQIVADFAAKQPHWQAVEHVIPTMIPLAKQMKPGASETDVLAAAYDMAVNALPELRQKLAAQAPDPAVTAAQAAKAVNVKPVPGDNKAPLSEDEALAAAYDRAMKRR